MKYFFIFTIFIGLSTSYLKYAFAYANIVPMNKKFPYLLANGKLAPPHRGKFIELLSHPIRTTYSEVFWTQQDPVPLPAEFVEKYAGKTVGFVGYEADVVRINQTSGKYASVPCYEQYNHHYAVSLLGNESKMAFVGRQTYLDERDIMAHRHAPQWQAQTLPGADPNSIVPVMQMFVEGNGNEHRRTFKWMPKGYAQYLESPTSFSPNFMMINTNNPAPPNWGKRGGPLPKGGEMPGWISKGSRAPEGAEYSGLLECPCTTRVRKVFTGHTPRTQGICAASTLIKGAEECFTASSLIYASSGFDVLGNNSVTDATEPLGCYVIGTPKGYEVYYNNDTSSTAQCGDKSGRPTRSTGHESIVLGSNFFGPGSKYVNVSLDLNERTKNATIVLTGPSDVWFGVGFDAKAMADTPYTNVVQPPSSIGKKAIITERRLANHAPGKILPSSKNFDIISDVVKGEMRTVTIQRPLVGSDSEHYAFKVGASALNLIAAIGSTPTFAYHGNTRGGSALMLVEVGAPVCLCESEHEGGSINGLPWTSDCFNPNLIEQQNPSCDIRTYRGGMTCCHHHVHLLDANQNLPAKVDEFYLKFRFYYEEAPIVVSDPAATKNVFFMFREVEFNHGEYDIPQCIPGTDPRECVHTLISNFQVKDTISDCKGDRSKWMCAPSYPSFPQSQEIDLIHVSGHCHAPSCLSMELINADTGQSICLVTPIYGNGGDEVMNENGYVVGLPPCVWSNDPNDGLEKPLRLALDTNLTAIKKSNSTYFHYGVMSHFQMRGAWAE